MHFIWFYYNKQSQWVKRKISASSFFLTKTVFKTFSIVGVSVWRYRDQILPNSVRCWITLVVSPTAIVPPRLIATAQDPSIYSTSAPSSKAFSVWKRTHSGQLGTNDPVSDINRLIFALIFPSLKTFSGNTSWACPISGISSIYFSNCTVWFFSIPMNFPSFCFPL